MDPSSLKPSEIVKAWLHRAAYLQRNEPMVVPVHGLKLVLAEYQKMEAELAADQEPAKRGPGRPKKVTV